MPDCQFQERLTMATKEELIAQIKNHEEAIPRLEALLRDVTIQIGQLKATIELKKKALAEKD